MDDERNLERLIVETTIQNCLRKLLYCEPSERELLLAVYNEATHELAEMVESDTVHSLRH